MAGDTKSDEVSEAGSQSQENTEKYIIDELISSAFQAIIEGRTNDEIANCFAIFYDDSAIISARDKLQNLIAIPKRSTRRDKDGLGRAKDVTEIIVALRKIDFRGQNIRVIVSDLNQVCHVDSELEDELQLRHEIRLLRSRLAKVEEMCGSIMGISNKLDNIETTLNSINSSNVSQSYSDKIKSGASLTSSSLVPSASTQDISEKIPEMCDRPKSINPFVTDPNENRRFLPTPAESSGWKTVSRKKQRIQRHVLGCNETATVKSSGVKVMRLFVSRCHPNTTPEMLTHDLTETSNLDILAIEKLKTRFDTYASFKITINKNEVETKDILNQGNWPKGIFVRPYLTNRWNAKRNGNTMEPNTTQ
ncbi:unnamed protein product [Orchesella dallaii]|uniref:Uncharacterized protein n=1 Tax=Orchesella dallaii TaxID=48710 RepID=A0ABP1PJ12_9HEXA